ncbi:organic hydroperoxide resistance protein [Salimicrobium jeotgali]|uniref:Organic hydroperoxide resistance protein n=1 Tax=Salimicrobium jeotgali TaxID=1230341 RepID=K2FI60_9BACI|nr:organic hydroperoxide resistance protein [Salimicrobium jeotgali]AKG03368.1 organic hydroperoxide resistance protein [Salimicrobium jeotgali]EKE30751.1 organic hydroperoxide resistance protein [Salimicrobium jeotgali]MBM7697523.1 Ohr subfamily peroxiredoxin [Salimicrobium jeotgali]
MSKILYTAKATAEGGREGNVKTDSNTLDLDLAMPSSLGGEDKEGATNPEELFAAGYAACFDSALQLAASQAKKEISSRVSSEVSIGKQSDGLGLSAKLHVEVKGVTQEEAEELVSKAHKLCPYSKATRGNMDVEIETNAV